MMLVAQTDDRGCEEVDGLPERRRGLRIRQSRPIKVFEPTVGRYFGGQTADISSTGLRLELPAAMPIRPGKTVCIHVGLATSGEGLANRRQMIPARVVWIDREAAADGRMVAGVEFEAAMAARVDAA